MKSLFCTLIFVVSATSFAQSDAEKKCDEIETTWTGAKKELACLATVSETKNQKSTTSYLKLKRAKQEIGNTWQGDTLVTRYGDLELRGFYQPTNGQYSGLGIFQKTSNGTGLSISTGMAIQSAQKELVYSTCGGGQECDDVDKLTIRLECAITDRNVIPDKWKCNQPGIE